MKKINEYPEILTAKMIAEYLEVGYTKALNIIKYSNLDSLKLGKEYRVTKKAFEAWLYAEGKREFLCEA